MKSIRYAILFLIICSVALGALTKTTSIVELDAWQEVADNTFATGAAGDVSDSYETIVYFEVAYTHTLAQDGVDVTVEVSYGDDNWVLLVAFTTPEGPAQTGSALNGGEPAGETNIALTNLTDFSVNGRKWFIQDSTAGDSESVRTKAQVGTVEICHDLLRAHDNGDLVWAYVHDYVIPIPAAFAYVRVLVHNIDADADVFYTTRISKVTSL